METIKSSYLETDLRKGTPFTHILLTMPEIDFEKINDALESETLQLQITVNEQPLSIVDLNAVFASWCKQYEKALKEKLQYEETFQAQQVRANELLSQQMGNLKEVLVDFENQISSMIFSSTDEG